MKQEIEQNEIREPVNVCSKGIGIVTLDDENKEFVDFLIHKNTALPSEAVFELRTQKDNQTSVEFCIAEQATESESPNLEDNTRIGLGDLVGFPADLPAGSPIIITFRLEEDGTLKVRGFEPSSNTNLDFELKVENGVMTPAEISGWRSKKALLSRRLDEGTNNYVEL